VRHRAEDDAVGALAGLERGIRQRRAVGLERLEADRHRLVGQVQAGEPAHLAQHMERRGRDFRADAVAFQHQNIEWVRRHGI
jgi:hypothetical protein